MQLRLDPPLSLGHLDCRASRTFDCRAISGFGGATAAPVSDVPIEVRPEDFDAFERILGEVQTAYGAEDLGALSARMTPESDTIGSVMPRAMNHASKIPTAIAAAAIDHIGAKPVPLATRTMLSE